MPVAAIAPVVLEGLLTTVQIIKVGQQLLHMLEAGEITPEQFVDRYRKMTEDLQETESSWASRHGPASGE